MYTYVDDLCIFGKMAILKKLQNLYCAVKMQLQDILTISVITIFTGISSICVFGINYIKTTLTLKIIVTIKQCLCHNEAFLLFFTIDSFLAHEIGFVQTSHIFKEKQWWHWPSCFSYIVFGETARALPNALIVIPI